MAIQDLDNTGINENLADPTKDLDNLGINEILSFPKGCELNGVYTWHKFIVTPQWLSFLLYPKLMATFHRKIIQYDPSKTY
jgi:hypothetical protein